MKRQFLHELYSSFVLWFDHTLLAKGEAYSNTFAQMYPMADDRYPTFAVYGSPYKQWVYDSSITGALIPSGIYSNGNFFPRGASGLKLDFNNGGALFPSGGNIPVSGQISPKEFNIYTTTKTDQELIFEQKINLASEFSVGPSGITSKDLVAPCVFLRFNTSVNEPFALGGEYQTRVRVRATILSDTSFKLDAVGNIFVDQKENNFLVFDKTPLNEYFDLKTGFYSYNDYITQYFDTNKLAYIEEVDFSRLTVTTNTRNPDLLIGFLDFTVCLSRFPHLE